MRLWCQIGDNGYPLEGLWRPKKLESKNDNGFNGATDAIEYNGDPILPMRFGAIATIVAIGTIGNN
jgi:hypothetical protein